MAFPRQDYWSGLPFLLQGIFLSQGSNPGLLHCRWILYHLTHQGSTMTALVSHQHQNMPLFILIHFPPSTGIPPTPSKPIFSRTFIQIHYSRTICKTLNKVSEPWSLHLRNGERKRSYHKQKQMGIQTSKVPWQCLAQGMYSSAWKSHKYESYYFTDKQRNLKLAQDQVAGKQLGLKSRVWSLCGPRPTSP